MKRAVSRIAVLAVFAVIVALAGSVYAASFTVDRMEIAGGLENKKPAGIASSFPATQEKVFCYIELGNIPQATKVTYVWTLGLNEMAKVTQDVKKSNRWRTWCSKSIGGMKGDWKVDILDEAGTVVKSATFTIQ